MPQSQPYRSYAIRRGAEALMVGRIEARLKAQAQVKRLTPIRQTIVREVNSFRTHRDDLHHLGELMRPGRFW